MQQNITLSILGLLAIILGIFVIIDIHIHKDVDDDKHVYSESSFTVVCNMINDGVSYMASDHNYTSHLYADGTLTVEAPIEEDYMVCIKDGKVIYDINTIEQYNGTK